MAEQKVRVPKPPPWEGEVAPLAAGAKKSNPHALPQGVKRKWARKQVQSNHPFFPSRAHRSC